MVGARLSAVVVALCAALGACGDGADGKDASASSSAPDRSAASLAARLCAEADRQGGDAEVARVLAAADDPAAVGRQMTEQCGEAYRRVVAAPSSSGPAARPEVSATGGGPGSDLVPPGTSGADADAVARLAQVGEVLGYGPVNDPEGFAYVMGLVCDEVQSGAKSWSDIVAEDVANGAPPGAARRLSDHLRAEFCPSR